MANEEKPVSNRIGAKDSWSTVPELRKLSTSSIKAQLNAKTVSSKNISSNAQKTNVTDSKKG